MYEMYSRFSLIFDDGRYHDDWHDPFSHGGIRGLDQFSDELRPIFSIYEKLALISESKVLEVFQVNKYRYGYSDYQDSERYKLHLIGITHNSPVRVDLVGAIPKAVTALADLIERLYSIRESRECRRLENYSKRLDITLTVLEKLNVTDKMTEKERIVLASELLSDLSKIEGNKRLHITNIKEE